MDRKFLATVGEYTAAKIDYLGAGRDHIDPETGRRGGVGVNSNHCRPLHPHGQRMIQEGLMTLERIGTDRCRHTVMVITDKGLAEIDRLEHRLRKKERRHGNDPTGYVRPGSTRKTFPPIAPVDVQIARRARARAWLIEARKQARGK